MIYFDQIYAELGQENLTASPLGEMVLSEKVVLVRGEGSFFQSHFCETIKSHS